MSTPLPTETVPLHEVFANLRWPEEGHSISQLIIELIPTCDLSPWARNSRTHSKKQLRQIGESIRTFGFTNPVLIDTANTILAGHGRVEAAKLGGMTAVPCVRLEHMTPAQKRAYVLADNKMARKADFEAEVMELREMLGAEADPKMRKHLEDDIGQSQTIVDTIDRALSGRLRRG